jgi:hypothetical protein
MWQLKGVSMRQRELMYLAAGLVVGVLVSVLLVVGGIVTPGSGVQPASVDLSYFQVDMQAARTWVLETSSADAIEAAEAGDALAASIDQIEALPSAENFRQGLRDAEGAIDMFLSQSYRLIAGTDVPGQSAALDQEEILTCLGMDDDPYNVEGPVFYLYVKVPSEQASVLPATWTPLDAPKNNDLYWQLLSCQPSDDI